MVEFLIPAYIYFKHVNNNNLEEWMVPFLTEKETGALINVDR